MRKLSKLIFSRMLLHEKPCIVSAYVEDNQIMELRVEEEGKKTLLGNIYLAQVENIADNIQAAFVQITPGLRCYLSLEESKYLIYASEHKNNRSLKPGDQILVQVSREAMKGKLPAISGNLNFTGKYLVLTTGDKKIGLSGKLKAEDRKRLSKWFEEEITRPDKEFGLIIRTNAADATKEEIFNEFEFLKKQYEKVVNKGIHRTSYSLLYENEPMYMSVVRDSKINQVEEIITDVEEIHTSIQSYIEEICPQEKEKLRLYNDKLLPLYKLYRIETAIDDVWKEKIWLNSGGFLVIQQTEAFVSIDVNSGKYTGKKKAEETFRKINLEAAKEISRQLRLRNLSGIILIDFINMSNKDHQDELFHVLQKYLRKDPVKTKVVDITPLHILEMTRKKVRRPLIEDLREIVYSE